MINNKYFAIDAHCHIYPEKIAARAIGGTDAFYSTHSVCTGVVDDMLSYADRAGIDKALVHSVATTKRAGVAHIGRALLYHLYLQLQFILVRKPVVAVAHSNILTSARLNSSAVVTVHTYIVFRGYYTHNIGVLCLVLTANSKGVVGAAILAYNDLKAKGCALTQHTLNSL